MENAAVEPESQLEPTPDDPGRFPKKSLRQALEETLDKWEKEEILGFEPCTTGRLREILSAYAESEPEYEWGVQFDHRVDPTMNNPSGIVTNTQLVAAGKEAAELAVSVGRPLGKQNHRLAKRTPAGPWERAE
jgi:hypothetical protein